MEQWIYYIGGLGVAIFIAILFEDVRDFISDGFEEVISFEWIGDFWDFLSSAFEDIGEFSVYGITFAILSLGVSYATRWLNFSGENMGIIESMTQYMSPTQRILWTILSYAGAGIAGYFMGKAFENTA
jgi:hypothetical protein